MKLGKNQKMVLECLKKYPESTAWEVWCCLSGKGISETRISQIMDRLEELKLITSLNRVVEK